MSRWQIIPGMYYRYWLIYLLRHYLMVLFCIDMTWLFSYRFSDWFVQQYRHKQSYQAISAFVGSFNLRTSLLLFVHYSFCHNSFIRIISINGWRIYEVTRIWFCCYAGNLDGAIAGSRICLLSEVAGLSNTSIY